MTKRLGSFQSPRRLHQGIGATFAKRWVGRQRWVGSRTIQWGHQCTRRVKEEEALQAANIESDNIHINDRVPMAMLVVHTVQVCPAAQLMTGPWFVHDMMSAPSGLVLAH